MHAITRPLAFIFCLFLLNNQLAAQPLFSLNPDYFFVTTTLPDTLLDFENISSYSTFEENTSEIIYLKWQVIVPAECPTEWKFLVGDTQLHWPSSVTSNIDPSINLFEPMPLNPALDNYFQFDVRPFQVSGCCQVQVLFSLVDEPDSILEVITYDISMLDSSCFISNATKDVELDSPLIYPNPTNGHLIMTNYDEINTVVIFSANGLKISQIDKPSNEINISNFSNGFYYLKMTTNSGSIHWEKVVVSHD